MPEITGPDGGRQAVAQFTPEEVESLNAYQASGAFHPFTCPNSRCRRCPSGGILKATPAGWVCDTCDYTQGWAWGWMADNSWPKGPAMPITKE